MNSADRSDHSYPIVIIHRGYDWYLPYTLRQARLFNPSSPVILVTDQKRPFLRLFAKIMPMDKHMGEATEFAKIYTHLSHNKPAFELFCFQRWFILHSVMTALGYDHCFYLDTDVLLYSNISAVSKNYAQAEMTVSFEQGPYSTFINNRTTLRGFCDYITYLFTHKVESMRADFESWKANGGTGGISDMHALKEYVKASQVRVSDTANIVEDSAFDTVIHHSDGYEMRDGLKTLEWINGQPHARHINSGKRIRFHSLHMQGNAKGLILSHHTKPNWVTLLIRVYNRFRT